MTEGNTESRHFQRGSVRLHYTVAGSGPTLLFIHGLPDFWKGWRYQIAYFRNVYRIVALDLRGVNLSDQPVGIGAYRMSELVRDAVGLINHLGLEKVTIVGHDWGALIGWWTAILAPKRIERLVAFSAPHPTCYATARENGNVYYPPDYRAQVVTAQPGALFEVDRMTRRVADPVARAELTDALQRSGIECLRNFYRANEAVPSVRLAALPPVRVPVLSLYGENDEWITPEAYEKSALYVRSDFKFLAVPKAGHFPHQDAPRPVNLELERWLHDHH